MRAFFMTHRLIGKGIKTFFCTLIQVCVIKFDEMWTKWLKIGQWTCLPDFGIKIMWQSSKMVLDRKIIVYLILITKYFIVTKSYETACDCYHNTYWSTPENVGENFLPVIALLFERVTFVQQRCTFIAHKLRQPIFFL